MNSQTSKIGTTKTRSKGLAAARSRVNDLHFSQLIDNSGLVRKVDPRKRRQCFRFLFFGICLFLGFLGYALYQFECLRLEYQMTELRARYHTLSEWNHKLRLEKAALGRLERIEIIARKELGLQPLRTDQVIYMDPKLRSKLNITLAHNENADDKSKVFP